VVEELRKLKEPFQVCYEASLGYGYLYDQIGKLRNARKTTVAHPGHLRLIYRSKKKNDKVDSRKIAQVMYLDQVPAIHVPAEDVRSWRGLIEWRQKLLRRRVMVKNQIRGLLKGCGIVPLGGPRLWSKRGMQWIQEQVFSMPHDTLRRDMLLEMLEAEGQRIAQVEVALDQMAQRHPGVALLQTIPGIGPRTAEAFVAYIDEAQRFANIRSVGAYLGLVPRQDASSDRNYLGHITKDGPATVRKLLVEAVWQAMRGSPRIKGHFEKISQGDKERKKIAIVATARWLATVMLSMLKSGECWRAEVPAEKQTAEAKTSKGMNMDTMQEVQAP